MADGKELNISDLIKKDIEKFCKNVVAEDEKKVDDDRKNGIIIGEELLNFDEEIWRTTKPNEETGKGGGHHYKIDTNTGIILNGPLKGKSVKSKKSPLEAETPLEEANGEEIATAQKNDTPNASAQAEKQTTSSPKVSLDDVVKNVKDSLVIEGECKFLTNQKFMTEQFGDLDLELVNKIMSLIKEFHVGIRKGNKQTDNVKSGKYNPYPPQCYTTMTGGQVVLNPSGIKKNPHTATTFIHELSHALDKCLAKYGENNIGSKDDCWATRHYNFHSALTDAEIQFNYGKGSQAIERFIDLFCDATNKYERTCIGRVLDIMSALCHGSAKTGGIGHDSIYFSDKDKRASEVLAELLPLYLDKTCNQKYYKMLREEVPQMSKVMEVFENEFLPLVFHQKEKNNKK